MKSGPRKFELTADVLLRAYSIGVFPMAESREATELFWVEPQERGVFPLDGLVVSRSLARTVRSDRFEVVADRDFAAVMRACAERDNTWINDEILRLYACLHRAGHAHSIEAYEGGALVGGLYGVSLRSVFFGESMFHRARDASKVALVHLVARLRAGGFRLLDTQFLTEHLASLGAVAVSREDFRAHAGRIASGRGRFRRRARSPGAAGRRGFVPRSRHGNCEANRGRRAIRRVSRIAAWRGLRRLTRWAVPESRRARSTARSRAGSRRRPPICWPRAAPRPNTCSGASASPSASTATRTRPSA